MKKIIYGVLFGSLALCVFISFGCSSISDGVSTTTTSSVTTTSNTSGATTTTSSSTTTTVTGSSTTTTVTTTSTTTTTAADSMLIYQIFPDTSDPPQLTFYWGQSRETVVPPSLSDISSRYGGWEGGGGAFKAGYEPASESEMVLTTTREPIYSYTKGTIVEATYEAANYYGQPEGEVGIRYGRKYMVKHVHVVEIQPQVQVGQTIEAGTLIGYTEQMGGGGFWEVEMNWLKSETEIVAVPVVFFLNSASQQVFNGILTAVGQPSWYHTAVESTAESWVPYVGTHEAWADAMKFGIKPEMTSGFKSPQEYYGAFGLSWIFN